MRRTNDNGMPRGAGSIQMRGQSYWLIYSDIDGRKIQENAHTQDLRVARILSAERALERTAKFVSQLRAVIDENSAHLSRAGWYRFADGGFGRIASAGNRGASRGMGRDLDLHAKKANGSRKTSAA